MAHLYTCMHAIKHMSSITLSILVAEVIIRNDHMYKHKQFYQHLADESGLKNKLQINLFTK